ncbi:Lipase, GDSL [Ostreococcus tauri]|uniref:Lipase, GDSL n=1 Tax=Ostreococcus tauri TaxID=70448 RepID=A0A090N2M7_OSTTA|nr:Lipase, GDSL [Ostreococcus tauri]CEF96508.1 Lipase, GDSL [Ostreococcus tauri]|eukprot:XP_022838134.1 Lipase, GDSL [Ostreococcus tauri]
MPPVRRRRIVLYGDSLTQRSFEPYGFGAELASAFSRTCDVQNRGFGGYNSRLCARNDVLEYAFGDDSTYPGKIYLSTVLLGTNDATRMVNAESEKKNRVRVDISEYEKNMYTILKRAAEASEVVIAISPPPTCDKLRRRAQKEKWGAKWVGSEFEDRRPDIAKYARALKRVVKRLDGDGYTWVYGCDIHSAMGADAPEMLGDGVHFNEEGQHFVAENIMGMLSFLNAKEPSWNADTLLPDFPYGHEIRDPSNAEVSEEELFRRHDEAKEKWNESHTLNLEMRRSGATNPRMTFGAAPE